MKLWKNIFYMIWPVKKKTLHFKISRIIVAQSMQVLKKYMQKMSMC